MNETNQQYRNLLAQAVSESTDQESTKESIPNLDGYQIEYKLGQGGMGTVYRAIDTTLNRLVAIKVFSSSSLEPMSIERFKQESQIMARLNHPNVVAIYGVTTDTPVCLILEYLEGGDLGGLIQQRGLLTVEETQKIGLDICAGLAAVHAQNVIHRDLKPANILLTNDGVAKVADLGIAMDKASATMTMTGTYVGSLAYTAPEQMSGIRDSVDQRADIWSMGVLLYEMLIGSPPQIDVGSDHLMNVPPKMRSILKRCLRTDPEDRYASISELSSDLLKMKSSLKPPLLKRTVTFVAAVALASFGIGATIHFSKSPTSKSSKPTPSESLPIEIKVVEPNTNLTNKLDLIAQLKLPLEADSGTWHLNRNELRCSRANGPSVISFPVKPIGDNYDIDLELSRYTGSSGAAIYLPTSIGNLTLDLDGWNRGLSGIQTLDGENLKQHDQMFHFSMTNQRFYRVRIQVRKDRISITIDGEKIHTCLLTGKRGGILNLWQLPRKGLISVAAYNSGMIFKNIIFTPRLP